MYYELTLLSLNVKITYIKSHNIKPYRFIKLNKTNKCYKSA